MPSKTYSLNFLGDVMLGRLIDQLFSTHVHCPSEAQIISSISKRSASLRSYGPTSPWGTMLPLVRSSDLTLVNLETAVTNHEIKWPGKVFNYRMHPANVEALKTARVDYVSLANNHILDFGEEGLAETVRTLRHAGIVFAGVGETREQQEEAWRPAVLCVPRDEGHGTEWNVGRGANRHNVYVFSASDHPSDWHAVPQFNLIDYTASTRERLKRHLQSIPNGPHRPALKIFSVHWGPNYSWHPAQDIRELAHFLVDECGVDIVHGHSSHHVQGVEVYNGKLILYGCGDFVDDYAVVGDGWRNDLSALWRVTVQEVEDDDDAEEQYRDRMVPGNLKRKRLKPVRLEIYPNLIKQFQAGLLEPGQEEHEWVREKLLKLSTHFGTQIREDLGDKGQIVIDIQ